MKEIAAEKLRGRRGAVLLATGALLGAIVVGPGGSLAASVLKLTTSSADKRYVKSGSVLAAGRTIEAKQDHFTATAFTPVAQTSIKAPVPGLVQVTATISAEDDATFANDGKLQYQVKVGNTVLDPTDPAAFQLDLPAGGGRRSGTITGVVKVPLGAAPIVLNAQEKGTGSVIQGRSISAVFVPAGKFPKSTKKTTTTGTGKKPVKPVNPGNVGP
jgi:hypothetical protein